MKKLLFISCLICFSLSLKGQNEPSELAAQLTTNLDSISSIAALKAQENHPIDSTNAYLMVAAKGMLYLSRVDSCAYFVNQMDTAGSSFKSKADFLNLSAAVKFYSGDPNAGVEIWKDLLPLARMEKDSATLSKSLGNISATYLDLEMLDSALIYLPQAIEIDQALNDTEALAYDYNLLGVAYFKKELPEKSIEVLKKGLELETSDFYAADLHLNLANAYSELDRMDECEIHAKKGYVLFSKNNNVRGMKSVLKQLSLIAEMKGDYKESIELEQESLQIAQAIGDERGIAGSQGNLAKKYLLNREYDKSLMYADSAIAKAKKLDDPEILKKTTSTKITTLAALGRVEDAINVTGFLEQYDLKKQETIYADQLSELEAKFNKAEQDKQIAEAELEIQQLNANRNMAVGGVAIILLLGTFIFWRNRAQQKAALQEAIISEREISIANEISAAEKERATISRELHDGIGQQLSAIKLKLNNLLEGSTDEASLKQIQTQVAESADDVRKISHSMMPRALAEKGLTEAIDQLLQNTFGGTNIQVNYDAQDFGHEISKSVQVNLYRIAQELIQNIQKHSKANQIDVMLYQASGKTILCIEDDGVGIKNTSKSGHGLNNIKNRVNMFNGNFNLDNADKGTVAMISIPTQND